MIDDPNLFLFSTKSVLIVRYNLIAKLVKIDHQTKREIYNNLSQYFYCQALQKSRS